ncbi:MAG: hypothetical protein JW951_07830, partial [Lentisphaerae bacterium]|nr:hypothetical protein [Lentisphaerota bacterium]
FLEAGLEVGLRATVNLETRAFLAEYADVEITSPGEPGVTYIMGAGFARRPEAGTPQARGLAGYRRRAGERNAALIERINRRLPVIALDYARDVLPLTPAGAPTERHIVSAYARKAREVFGSATRTAAFWSEVFGVNLEETAELLADTPAFEERVRAKLVKRGGLGYRQPSPDTFPSVDAFTGWVASCGAIPMVTWLDGTSPGEQDAAALLDGLIAKGCAALNIIPERNWNLDDPAVRELKIRNLDTILSLAEDRGLPVNIGTEMNKLGLPFEDKLNGAVLQRYRAIFLRGARIMVGHTRLLRYAGYSYIGPRARADFPDTAARNAFFEAVGALPPLRETDARRLQDAGPDRALARLREQAAA